MGRGRWFLILALVALGLALLLAGRRPVEYAAFEVPLFTASFQPPDSAVEVRTVRGRWAQTVPVGQNVPVEVNLEGSIDRGEALSPVGLSLEGLYAGSGQLEARLDIRALTVQPSGSIVRNLAPAEPAGFFWRLNAPRAGAYEGTLWMYVTTPEDRQLVFARPVTVTAVDALGFPPHQVRTAGWVSLALGLVAAFPLGQAMVIRSWGRIHGKQPPA